MAEKNDRLLTTEEINSTLAENSFHAKELLPSYEYDFVIGKAQDAKTARMVAEEIFGKLEKHSIIKNEIEAQYPPIQGAKPKPTRKIRMVEAVYQVLKNKYPEVK